MADWFTDHLYDNDAPNLLVDSIWWTRIGPPAPANDRCLACCSHGAPCERKAGHRGPHVSYTGQALKNPVYRADIGNIVCVWRGNRAALRERRERRQREPRV